MAHFQQGWGQSAGFAPYSQPTQAQPTSHTQNPIVTGTSVLGLKFADGVVIAADNLASYGSLARFSDVKRLRKFNNNAVVGIGGDVSDMQHLDRMLLSLQIGQEYQIPSSTQSATAASEADDHSKTQLSAKNLHTYIAKVMYKRRTDFNPLWNALLIGGLDDEGAPFLASADLLGTTFSSPTLATGFGAHLAVPILRRHVPDEEASKKLGREEAVKIIKECMKVLFYRDARSSDNYSIAVVSKSEGVTLLEDEKLENQSWAFAETIKGYGTQVV